MERALARADPVVAAALDRGPVILVAAGKAAVPMSQALLATGGRRVVRGVVAAPGGAGPDDRLDFYRAGHPTPTAASVAAGRRALDLARSVPDDGSLVVLLSGGASALLAAPVEGLGLADKVAATRALLGAGVPIDGINCVRKHLSAVKGGRLAAATPGMVLTLAISDVVGPVADDPAVIGSGPTAPDPTTFSDALDVVERFDLAGTLPPAVHRVLHEGQRGSRRETPKPGDASLQRSTIRVIGGRMDAMQAAADAARTLGYSVAVVEAPVVGEARRAGEQHGEMVRGVAASLARPACVISAGETTVEVRGGGRGGRNQEFALASVGWIHRMRAETVLASVGSDGVDGPTDAAGAIVDRSTQARSRARRLGEWTTYLDRNDSYTFFDAIGDLLRPGPTDTNVGDLQVVLIADDDC